MRRTSKWVLAGAALLSSLGLTNASYAQCASDACSSGACFSATAPAQIFTEPGCTASGCGGGGSQFVTGGLLRNCKSGLSKCGDAAGSLFKGCGTGLSMCGQGLGAGAALCGSGLGSGMSLCGDGLGACASGLGSGFSKCRSGLSGLFDRAPSMGCGDGCGMGGCDMGGCGEGCGGGGASAGGINFGGWLQAGYHTDATGLANPRIGGAAFNQRPNEVQLHQAYLFAEKIADGSNGFDWGFRADAVYGTDGPDAQAFGNQSARWDNSAGFDHGNDYGFALPQAYLEFAKGDWSVIAGHFYTLVGYEVVTAPDNFFYSHSYTMYNSEPFTHTGVLATYAASDNVELYGGWTAGWDTGFDQFGDGSSFLGGASVSLSDATTLTYITTFGDFGARGAGSGSYGHSIVLDTSLSDKLNWVAQSDYVDDGVDEQYGFNNYLIYMASDKLGYGVRTEWWRNNNLDFYEITGGVNYRVRSNVIVRPEVRWDKQSETDIDQVGFGVDAILTF